MNKTWEDLELRSFQLTGNNNIYKAESLEGILVEAVIDFYTNKSNLFIMGKKENILTKLILSKIKEKGIQIQLDQHYLYRLPQKSIWHARVSGVLEITPKNKETTEKPILFGIFLESGLNDLWTHERSIKFLEKQAPHNGYKKHLMQVAQLASEFRKENNIPDLKYDGNSVTINNVRGMHQTIYNEEYLHCPLQTWSYVDENEVHAATRGSFHHLGDNLAFIWAALQFGDCCIVGNDEFGDLQVLVQLHNMTGKPSFGYNRLVNTTLNVKDFDYIYGVPRSKAHYPTAKNYYFTYAGESYNYDNVSKDNLTLSNSYWKNDVFLKYAGRKLEETTIQQIAKELKEIVEKYLPENLQNIIKETPKGFLNSFAKIIDLENENIQGIDKKIEKEFSFFIKTIAHKVSCTIFNSNDQTGMGFFKKANSADEIKETSSSQAINLSLIMNLLYKNAGKIYQEQENISFLALNNIKHVWESSEFWQRIINFKLSNKKFDCFMENDNQHYDTDYNNYDLYKFWTDSQYNTLIRSELVAMQYEYRVFVVGHKVATTSPCFRNTTPFNAWSKGIFDPRLADGHNAYDVFLNKESRHIVAQYAKFVRKFTQEMKKCHPAFDNYVLDVCWSKVKDGNPKYEVLPIEINSINLSGAYQIDFRKVCAAIAKKPRHQGFINTLNLDYQELLKPYGEKEEAPLINPFLTPKIDLDTNFDEEIVQDDSFLDLNMGEEKQLQEELHRSKITVNIQDGDG